MAAFIMNPYEPQIGPTDIVKHAGRIRENTITTDDGVSLVVREIGPPDAPLTVVFAHGFCLRMAAWGPQLTRLERLWGNTVRLVAYDQRGHGRSGRADPASCTISQLGRDLQSVITTVAPSGPIVLVGHSMGGMTVLSHAEQFPHIIGTRVIGAALIATAAEGLRRSGLFPQVNGPVLAALRLGIGIAPRAANVAKVAAATAVTVAAQRRIGGFRIGLDPSVAMFGSTSIDTIRAFLESLEAHDETAALPLLGTVPSVVVCGETDMVTPIRNSEEIAAAMPRAEFVRVAGAGHMIQFEHPRLVTEAIARTVERAVPCRQYGLAMAGCL